MKKFIEAASGKTRAQLVLKNADIVDVFTQEIFRGDVAIQDGRIVGVGEYSGEKELDCSGKYIAPSFIDSHMHLESSLVTPAAYSDAVLPHGVTTVIADPHEIANVAGKEGIKYILDSSEKTVLDIFMMLPSCVPATQFESSGATLTADDLEEFYLHERVLGLGEVMNYPAVLNCEPDMLRKIAGSINRGKLVDGHGAGLRVNEMNAYASAGIKTDHECQSAQEAKERLRRGMYVMMREGTAAKNIRELSKVLTPLNSRRLCICTDDKHLDHLIEEGSVDCAVRVAIEAGIPAVTAYQMATLNSAECYGLKDRGAVAPGYKADFIIVSDLERVKIEKVFKNGELVAENGECIKRSGNYCSVPKKLISSLNFGEISKSNISISIDVGDKANIIEIIPNKLETRHVVEEVCTKRGKFQTSVERDQLKMLVVERHKNSGNIGKGIVKGFKLKKGAIAVSVSHDSHNVIAVGVDDVDLVMALNELRRIGGGIVLCVEGRVEAELKLEIGGLITEKSPSEVVKSLKKLHENTVKIMESGNFNPFLTLSFISLPVIPEIRLTDKGIFDVSNFNFLNLKA